MRNPILILIALVIGYFVSRNIKLIEDKHHENGGIQSAKDSLTNFVFDFNKYRKCFPNYNVLTFKNKMNGNKLDELFYDSVKFKKDGYRFIDFNTYAHINQIKSPYFDSFNNGFIVRDTSSLKEQYNDILSYKNDGIQKLTYFSWQNPIYGFQPIVIADLWISMIYSTNYSLYLYNKKGKLINMYLLCYAGGDGGVGYSRESEINGNIITSVSLLSSIDWETIKTDSISEKGFIHDCIETDIDSTYTKIQIMPDGRLIKIYNKKTKCKEKNNRRYKKG